MPDSAVVTAPPPAAAPAATPAPSNPALANAFNILDGMDHGGSGPQPEPRQTPDKPRDASGKFAAATPVEKPAEKPKEVADANKPPESGSDAGSKPAGDTQSKSPPAEPAKPTEKPKVSAWQFAREKEKEAKAAAEERDRLRTELEAVRAKVPTVADHPDYKSIQQQAEAATKRAQELEDHIRYVDYTKSKEYQEQYQKPYEETAAQAVNRATQLKVTNEDGTRRNLTPEEFWSIVRMGDEDDAVNAAEKLFGEGSSKASAVIERRNEIIRAHMAAEQAKEKYQKEGAERSRKAQADWEAQQRTAAECDAARIAKFKTLNEDGEKYEKLKDAFQAAVGDTEGAELLAKGRHDADRAFAAGMKLTDTDEEWTPDQLLIKHSVIRNRAGAFPYVLRQMRAALKREAEKDAIIAAYKKSAPGDGEVAGDAAPPSGSIMDQILAKADKLNQ